MANLDTATISKAVVKFVNLCGSLGCNKNVKVAERSGIDLQISEFNFFLVSINALIEACKTVDQAHYYINVFYTRVSLIVEEIEVLLSGSIKRAHHTNVHLKFHCKDLSGSFDSRNEGRDFNSEDRLSYASLNGLEYLFKTYFDNMDEQGEVDDNEDYQKIKMLKVQCDKMGGLLNTALKIFLVTVNETFRISATKLSRRKVITKVEIKSSAGYGFYLSYKYGKNGDSGIKLDMSETLHKVYEVHGQNTFPVTNMREIPAYVNARDTPPSEFFNHEEVLEQFINEKLKRDSAAEQEEENKVQKKRKLKEAADKKKHSPTKSVSDDSLTSNESLMTASSVGDEDEEFDAEADISMGNNDGEADISVGANSMSLSDRKRKADDNFMSNSTEEESGDNESGYEDESADDDVDDDRLVSIAAIKSGRLTATAEKKLARKEATVEKRKKKAEEKAIKESQPKDERKPRCTSTLDAGIYFTDYNIDDLHNIGNIHQPDIGEAVEECVTEAEAFMAREKKLNKRFFKSLTVYIEKLVYSEVHFEKMLVAYYLEKRKLSKVKDNESIEMDWAAIFTALKKVMYTKLKVSNDAIIAQLNAEMVAAGPAALFDGRTYKVVMQENIDSKESFTRYAQNKIKNVLHSTLAKVLRNWCECNTKGKGLLSKTLSREPNYVKFAKAASPSFALLTQANNGGEPVAANVDQLLRMMTHTHSNLDDIAFLCRMLNATERNKKLELDRQKFELKEKKKEQNKKQKLDEILEKNMEKKFDDSFYPQELADAARRAQSAQAHSATAQASSVSPPTAVLVNPKEDMSEYFKQYFVPDAAARSKILFSACGSFGTQPQTLSAFKSSVSSTLIEVVPFSGFHRGHKEAFVAFSAFASKLLDGIEYEDNNLFLLLPVRLSTKTTGAFDLVRFLVTHLVNRESNDNDPRDQIAELDEVLQKFKLSRAFEMLTCQWYIPFNASHGKNTMGDGYCYYRATFQLLLQFESNFQMSLEDLREADRSLRSEDSEENAILFHEHLSYLASKMTNERDHDKVATADHLFMCMDVFLDARYWGILEWCNKLRSDTTGFGRHRIVSRANKWLMYSTSSILDISDEHVLSTPSFKDIYTVLSKPPNFLLRHQDHFFISDAYIQTDLQHSMDAGVKAMLSEVEKRLLSVFESCDRSALCGALESLLNEEKEKDFQDIISIFQKASIAMNPFIQTSPIESKESDADDDVQFLFDSLKKPKKSEIDFLKDKNKDLSEEVAALKAMIKQLKDKTRVCFDLFD